MEHSKKQAYQFLNQLKIALLRWQEEYLHDLKNKSIITSIDGQAFNLPGDKYTEDFSLAYYMVRDPNVRTYLLKQEVPKSGYQELISDFLQGKESEEKEAKISTILQKIIRSRTFYDIRGRAEETPDTFKLKPKYWFSLEAYVNGWKSKILAYEGIYYNTSSQKDNLLRFGMTLNVYNSSAKIKGFHPQAPSIIYEGNWQRSGAFINIRLAKTGQKKGEELTIILLVGAQKKIEELTLIKGGFIGSDVDKEMLSSAEVFFQKIESSSSLEKIETVKHLTVHRSLRVGRNSLLLATEKHLKDGSSNIALNVLHRYVGVYKVHRVHQGYLDTYILRLYPDYRATFQHPDFFDGALMNCTIDILNNGTTLQLSVLHTKTNQVLMIILAKISDVKNVLVNQKQIMIDLTVSSLSQDIISFNRKNKDASLESPHLKTNRRKITDLEDFNDLKEVDKLRK